MNARPVYYCAQPTFVCWASGCRDALVVPAMPRVAVSSQSDTMLANLSALSVMLQDRTGGGNHCPGCRQCPGFLIL